MIDKDVINLEWEAFLKLHGKRIMYARLLSGMTQHEAAKLLKVTTQQYVKYEKGLICIPPNKLYKLAQTLNLKLEYFFIVDSIPVITKPSDYREVIDEIIKLQNIDQEIGFTSQAKQQIKDLIDSKL